MNEDQMTDKLTGTRAEQDRQLIIAQEIFAGRLVPADDSAAAAELAYERGMQEGLDLRDQLREQLADRDQDLKILGKEIDRMRAENERLSKHDSDCLRRGDDRPTSLCTCDMTDAEVANAQDPTGPLREALIKLAGLCISDGEALDRGFLRYAGEFEDALKSRANLAKRLLDQLSISRPPSPYCDNDGDADA